MAELLSASSFGMLSNTSGSSSPSNPLVQKTKRLAAVIHQTNDDDDDDDDEWPGLPLRPLPQEIELCVPQLQRQVCEMRTTHEMPSLRHNSIQKLSCKQFHERLVAVALHYFVDVVTEKYMPLNACWLEFAPHPLVHV
jgi:hypothetical protein